MASLFDKLSNSLKTPLSGFGINNVSAAIARNLNNPIGSAATQGALTKTFGSADEFMASYQNFEQVYKMSLAKELKSTALSSGQKRMIEAGMDAPVINLRLISNIKERQMLSSMLRNNVLNVDSLVKNFGAPGVGLPSSNLFRASARYLVDQRSGMNHPAINLINSLTFSIDPKKTGPESFGFGITNLPSSASLSKAKSMSENISAGKGVFQTKAGRPLKVVTMDVETSGLGIYDQVRSLAASTMEIQHGGTITHNADGFSTHFITPQMQQYTMRGDGGATTRLGTGVFQIEAKKAADGSLIDSVSDLTTESGRKQAVKYYKDFLRKATEADVVAGHNVQFDIQRVNMSIAGLGEDFTSDKEAVNLFQKFNKLSEQGKVINSLDLAKDYLTREAVSGLSGDEARRAQQMVSTLFAPETLVKASIGGSATPFSIGNIAGTTNLLELAETKGGAAGRDIVQNLARGGASAHQAQVDTVLTNFMMQFIHTGELKFGLGTLQGATYSSEARKTIMKSSAIVPTTNIADVRHMSDAVFNYAKTEKGMLATKLTTDTGGIISFSKSDGKFYEHAVDGSTSMIQRDSALARISDALDSSRAGKKSELLDTGINHLQASRTDRILSNVAKTSGISTSTSNSMAGIIRGRTDIAAEERFIDALSGTREFLGFNDYNYRPDILREKGITSLISKNYGMIDDQASDNYLTRLAKGGISGGFDDPYMRRNFVELATITSGTPYSGKSADYAGGIGSKIVRNIVNKTLGAGPISPSEFATRVGEFNANTGVRVGEYLSELGVSFAGTQRSNYLIGKSGEVTSRPVVATELLKNIQVSINDSTTGKRKKVGFLSDEFLSDYGHNKFGLSVTQRKEEKVVNLVFGNLAADTNTGQRVVGRRMSLEIAGGIVDQMDERLKASSIKDLVDEGFFQSAEQANDIKRRLKGERGGKSAFRKELARSISDRGLTTGSIAGRESEGIVALLEQVAGGIDNDTEAFRKGMQFAVSEFGDDYVAFQGRIDDTVLETLRASNPTLATDIEKGTFTKRAYDTYLATMERSSEDVGFRKRVVRAFSSKGLDSGIAGSKYFKGRSIRDEAVRQMYRKAAPKVGVGAAAVGLLSVGYYIAKKNRESNLYDETLKQQPKEGRSTVVSSNDYTIQQNPQTSTRRDPLVTAGVMGNLDRNKIGHTGMGPKKYDHLYR